MAVRLKPEILAGARGAIESVQDETARQVGLAALDAVEKVAGGGVWDESSLAKLTAATSSCEAVVAIHAADLLGILALDDHVLRDLIWHLVQRGNETARFCARSAAVNSGLPRPFVAEVLRVALADPSPLCRQQAANDAALNRITEVLPALIELRRSSNAPEQVEWLEGYIDLTRDGYSIETWSQEAAARLILKDDKARARFHGPICTMRVVVDGTLTGETVPEHEIRTRGAAAVARDIAERFRKGRRLAQAPPQS